MLQQIMKLSVILLFSGGVTCAAEPVKGTTMRVAKTTTTQIPGLYKRGKVAIEPTTCQPCPPPPPLIQPNSSVPLPNPNALPGAFFPLVQPNGLPTANLLQAAPQTVGLTFVGGYLGIDPQFFGTPPDTFGVIGKEQFVVGDNQGIVSYTRQGVRDGVVDTSGESLANLDGDFSLLVSHNDNRIRYDKLCDRFVYIQLNSSNGLPKGFTLAVSDSGVLSDETVWTVFSLFDSGVAPDRNNCPSNQGYSDDYPCMGIDRDAIYVAMASFSDLAWLSNSLYVIQKKSLYEGTGPVIITAFPDITRAADGSFVGAQTDYRDNSTVFPVDNYDPDPEFGYALCTDPVYFGRLQLFRILNAGSECPSLSGPVSIDVMQTYVKQIDVVNAAPFPQNVYGDIGRIETFDDRLADSTLIHNKQIYSCQSIRVDNTGVSNPQGDRRGVRWYQLDVTGDSKGKGSCKEKVTTVPALVQGGTLFDTAETNPLFYFFPAIMENHQGDISICGTVAGNNQNISAFFVGRQATDPLGTLRIANPPPSTYYTGSGHYTYDLVRGGDKPGGAGQRWGDMSFSSLDLDNKTIWTIQEVAVNGTYRRVVARLDAPEVSKELK